jgi:hypothetical protein
LNRGRVGVFTVSTAFRGVGRFAVPVPVAVPVHGAPFGRQIVLVFGFIGH